MGLQCDFGIFVSNMLHASHIPTTPFFSDTCYSSSHKESQKPFFASYNRSSAAPPPSLTLTYLTRPPTVPYSHILQVLKMYFCILH